MKRYKITSELKKSIKNSEYSLDKISKLVGFEIRNILYRNISIREDNLNKIRSLLKTNWFLKEINISYGKNLGEHASTIPIKQFQADENLSEFIGVMLGDGNISGNQIVISFDKRDRDYINYVKKLVEDVIGITLKELYEKSGNGFRLYCCNKLLIEKLIEFGLKRGNKIKNQIGIPRWIKENIAYSKRCIKGLVDTDGCIIFCKRDKQRSINFSNVQIPLVYNEWYEHRIMLMEFGACSKTIILMACLNMP